MNIRLTAQIKQHAGDILLECQDSFNYNIDNQSFAISDGVSQAYCPELWSRLLTAEYVKQPETFFIKSEIGLVLNPELNLKGKWQSLESNVFSNATPQEKFILSLKKESVGIGAATFIGVHLKSEGIMYQAIGDSVLFFYDTKEGDLKVVSSMISDEGMVFNNSPEYIDTNEHNQGRVIQGFLPYKDGILFMATDALSDWILSNKDVVKEKFERLISIGDHSAYSAFIDGLRTDKEDKIKDDDTSFIALEFFDSNILEPHFTINYAPFFDQLSYEDLLIQHKSASATIDELRQITNKAELELRKIKKESISKDTVILELEASKKTLQGDVANFKQELERLNNQIETLKSNLNQANNDKRSLSEKRTQLENEIKRLESEVNRLKGTIETMKKQPRQTDVNVEALTQKLAGANKRLEQFKQQIEQLRTVYSEKGGFDWTDFLSLIKVIEPDGQPSQPSYIEITTFEVTKDGGIKI